MVQMIPVCIWQPHEFSKDEHKFSSTKLNLNIHKPHNILIEAILNFFWKNYTIVEPTKMIQHICFLP